ncbi:cyclohexanone monooxygenase [Metarhizium album ARSEF 1941]|uniref:Cyclohexanone monooxygenase n=1 Tax=Metarhizium album (strain ARSEF 1941) TaxID=1081103 RepID=A0A0B2X1G7_METAS|nr:cyclohexanone monooxygenase [Metarhizium album ARSEF 1941]KHN98935.1 cyclohexanone monooxygenase [Metarhizium album ARSEF 1941]
MTADSGASETRAVPDVDLLARKYAEGTGKRFRPEGTAQLLGRQRNGALNAQPPNLSDGDEDGFSGLLHAVHQVEAGIDPDDNRLVDAAGGSGGTWYWTRYTGIMVDVKGCIYMPLLEQTGHIPRHRFPYGPGIRQWDLTGKGVFRTRARTYDWVEEEERWKFVVVTGGLLNQPKTPKIPGIDTFSGHMIVTNRPLEGKKVGIVGTGATAMQCVTELARWADQLFVFRRTPSGVDQRSQRPMAPETWQQISHEKHHGRRQASRATGHHPRTVQSRATTPTRPSSPEVTPSLASGRSTALHGMLSPWMPNMLLAGPSQTAACANFMYTIDNLARHGAYIVAEVLRRASDRRSHARGSGSVGKPLTQQGRLSVAHGDMRTEYLQWRRRHEEMVPRGEDQGGQGLCLPSGDLAYVELLEQWRAD